MATVTIKNVTKSFGTTPVLREFSEVFRDGEFVTLLGPSGCGKTTMLRMIAGFEKPTEGEIWIDETQVSGGQVFVPPEQREIGMVFQSYAVWPHMDVYHNVAYPLQIRRTDRKQTEEKVGRILETVHLAQYARRLPNQLSGGQQQRIALARALVAEPKLLLLDEPLSNLDAKLRESMRFEIKELTRELGITVVYVTHDQTEAMAMSDRIFVLNNGIVQQKGTPEEIYNHPANPFVADFLGKVDFFRGENREGRIRLTDWDAELSTEIAETELLTEKEGAVASAASGYTGAVQVAIRPENILICPKGEGIPARMTRMYYLGDVTDCRVQVGRAEIRIIGDGFVFRQHREGDEIGLRIREYQVFREEEMEDQLKILT